MDSMMKFKTKSEFSSWVSEFHNDNFRRGVGDTYPSFSLTILFRDESFPVSNKIKFSFSDLNLANDVLSEAKQTGFYSCHTLEKSRVISQEGIIYKNIEYEK